MIQACVKLAAWSIKQGDCSDWAGSRKHSPNPWHCHRCVLPTPDDDLAFECGWHSGWKEVSLPLNVQSWNLPRCLSPFAKLKNLFSSLLDGGRPKRATEWPASIHKGSFVLLSTSELQANYSNLEGSVYNCNQAQCLQHDLTSTFTCWVNG